MLCLELTAKEETKSSEERQFGTLNCSFVAGAKRKTKLSTKINRKRWQSLSPSISIAASARELFLHKYLHI